MKITEIAEAEEFGNSSPLAPTHDTPLVDPIVNEMLGASSGFTDDRRVLFTYGELRGYLRRISAATRREREAWKDAACEGIEAVIRRGCISINVGDAAVMRRAAVAACKLIRDWWKDHRADADTAQILNDVECALCKALDHRPRNCDLHATWEEASETYNKLPEEQRTGFLRWLYSPAADPAPTESEVKP